MPVGTKRTVRARHARTANSAADTVGRGRNHATGRLAAALLVVPVVLQTSTAFAAVQESPGEASLAVSVTASGTVARAYAWAVSKTSDAASRSTDSTGRASFVYTVSARAGAATDSEWRQAGAVTVTNPDTSAGGAAIAEVAVASDLGGGSACTVTGGDGVVVPPSVDGPGQITLPYSCTFTAAPAASGAVTATATWDPPGVAASMSATGSAPAAFVVTSESNKTVSVVDDKTVIGQRVVLDPSVTWEPGLVRSYTYDLTILGGIPGACAPHTNTATVDQPTGTDPTASTTVTVCTPEVLPAQAFGRATGSVRATCRGTVRMRVSNRTAETATYRLWVGRTLHKVVVKSLGHKRLVTQGRALARVTLKVGSTRLDRIRIPQRCEAPVVLPDTGLRVVSQ